MVNDIDGNNAKIEAVVGLEQIPIAKAVEDENDVDANVVVEGITSQE